MLSSQSDVYHFFMHKKIYKDGKKRNERISKNAHEM